MQSRGQANGSDGHEEHGDSVKRHTRSEVKQKEKDYRDYYLQMSLEEKRKLYKCKSKFNQLKDILTWEEFYHKNRERLLKKLGKKKTTPLYTVNAEINSKVSIWRGDITTLEIDVIVNAANSSLLGGGGVDGAIHEAAGRKLVEECVTLQGCKTGDAKITGGYKLPAKYVIHTVGPIGEKEPLLKSAYQNSLKVMMEKKLRSVALPCISTGIYGYDNQKACHVALKVVREFLTTNADSVDRVIFCLFLPKDVDLYEENMQIYFPVETVETSNLDDKEKTSGDMDMEKSVQTAKSKTKSKDSSPEKENAESAKAEKSSASSEGKTSTDSKEEGVVDVEQKETKRREKKAKILDKERTSGDVDMEKSVQTAKSNTKSKDSSPEKENAESAKAEKSSGSSDEKANTDTKEERVKQKETERSGKKANTLDKEKTSGDMDMEKSVQTAKSNTKSKDSSPKKENAESAKAEKSSASSEGKTSTDSKEGVVDVEQKETKRQEKKAKILDKKETSSDVEMKELEPATKSKIKSEDSSRGKEKAQSESDDMETSSVDKSSDDAQTSPERMDDSGNEKVGVEKTDVEQLNKEKKTITQTSRM